VSASTIAPDVFAARREKLRARLNDMNIEALLVSHAANRYYLSGFELHDPQCNESAGMLLITAKGKDHLLTDSRYFDAARRIWPESEVFIYGARRYAEIAGYVKGLGVSATTFESRAMSVDAHTRYADHMRLVPSVGVVEPLRLFKDAAEIAVMKRSAAVNHEVFARVPALLAPGKTEKELAWEFEKLFRDLGASELAFSSIVAVGPNGALPHAVPGDAVVTENCPVLVDMGGRFEDYCSDQTRTFWVGDAPADYFTRALELTQGAQKAAIDVIRPGLSFKEAYAAARGYFQKHGVEEAFTHALGHGVGLETHEAPSLNPNMPGALATGMVVTVEPGLYYPEWGGIRWEHMVLVTEDGCEIL